MSNEHADLTKGKYNFVSFHLPTDDILSNDGRTLKSVVTTQLQKSRGL